MIDVTRFHKAEGLLDRVGGLASVIDLVPDELSDAEVEGLARVLPPDTARTLRAIFAPHTRTVSIAFFKLASRWLSEARRVQEAGGKVLLVPFNFPVEVIHGFRNAIPITSEVLTTLAAAALEGGGERYWEIAMGLGLPDTLCSSNTVELGSVLSREDFLPDAIIQAAPGGCDANAKIHEFVAAHLGIPQFFLEKPTDDSSRGRALYRSYLQRLLDQLQEFVGEELDPDHVRGVLRQANRASEAYHDLWELKKHAPCPVPNVFALYTYGVRFSMWGRPEAADFMEQMVRYCRGRLERGEYPAPRERARTLWLYTGYYFDFLGFFNWMEERGITYLTDMLGTFFPTPMDLSTLDTMIDGMAEAGWNMPMSRQMGGESMMSSWLEDVTYTATDLRADAGIFCGHHSCKQTWSVFAAVRDALQERTGIPILRMQGDAWMRTMTPTSVIQEEIGSFVDQLVDRRPPRPRPRRRGLKVE